jgi:hypothetical protein
MENTKVTLGFVAAISLVAGAGGAWLATRGHDAGTAPAAQVATATGEVASTGVEQSEAVVADPVPAPATPTPAASLTTAAPAPPRAPERQSPARPARPASTPAREQAPLSTPAAAPERTLTPPAIETARPIDPNRFGPRHRLSRSTSIW